MSDAAPLSSLTPAQIKKLQRVFYMIDKDADGRVKESDVVQVLRNLGATDATTEAQACFSGSTPASLESMGFLTIMSHTLGPLSDVRQLMDAFASFDEKDEGMLDVDVVREMLDHDEDLLAHWLSPTFLDRSRKRFDYRKFVTTLSMCEWHDIE